MSDMRVEETLTYSNRISYDYGFFYLSHLKIKLGGHVSVGSWCNVITSENVI